LIFCLKFSVPKDANAIKITATYKDGEGDKATAEMRAVAFYSANEMYVHVGTSTEQGRLGENAVIHLRSNFGFQVYNYVVSVFRETVICFADLVEPHVRISR
jgi:hypothetical protein